MSLLVPPTKISTNDHRKLSRGELQLISIARAILKQPRIVFLDEPTSTVDSETEENVQRSLERLCRGRTTFVVA